MKKKTLDQAMLSPRQPAESSLTMSQESASVTQPLGPQFISKFLGHVIQICRETLNSPARLSVLRGDAVKKEGLTVPPISSSLACRRASAATPAPPSPAPARVQLHMISFTDTRVSRRQASALSLQSAQHTTTSVLCFKTISAHSTL